MESLGAQGVEMTHVGHAHTWMDLALGWVIWSICHLFWRWGLFLIPNGGLDDIMYS